MKSMVLLPIELAVFAIISVPAYAAGTQKTPAACQKDLSTTANNLPAFQNVLSGYVASASADYGKLVNLADRDAALTHSVSADGALLTQVANALQGADAVKNGMALLAPTLEKALNHDHYDFKPGDIKSCGADDEPTTWCKAYDILDSSGLKRQVWIEIQQGLNGKQVTYSASLHNASWHDYPGQDVSGISLGATAKATRGQALIPNVATSGREDISIRESATLKNGGWGGGDNLSFTRNGSTGSISTADSLRAAVHLTFTPFAPESCTAAQFESYQAKFLAKRLELSKTGSGQKDVHMPDSGGRADTEFR